jgi:hypothetical protein
VSLVGVSGGWFAVNGADSGAGGDGAGQTERPKNAPRRAARVSSTAPLGLVEVARRSSAPSRWQSGLGVPRVRPSAPMVGLVDLDTPFGFGEDPGDGTLHAAPFASMGPARYSRSDL